VNTCIDHLDRTAWRRVASTFDDYSYRQLWDFGAACADRLGACSEHVAIGQAGDVIGLADVRIKRLPLLGYGVAYVNGGPLVRRGASTVRPLRACLEALRREYVQRRGLLLRIQPALGAPDWNAAQQEAFSDLGFAASQRPAYRTLLVSLEQPLEQIRKAFDQKWRNGLNRAERNSLLVRSSSQAAIFEEFCTLYRQLLQRKGFDVDLSADFYAAVQSRLDGTERFLVGLVDLEGTPVAGHVASILGDTCVYLLGASNEHGMQSKASYLLQWHTIQAAKMQGCRWYDLGGIDPRGNPGVCHFKQGLGGIDVTAPGPFELPPAGLGRHIARGCERLYRSIRTRRLAHQQPGGQPGKEPVT
jgi:CelD/BcsL family acetyltransferase involved in cellulose biosynthesis